MFGRLGAVDLDDRLEVETLVSQMLGAITVVCDGAPSCQTRVGCEFVDFLAARGDVPAAAALAALRGLSVVPAVRDSIEVALELLSRRDVHPPHWINARLTLADCWRGGDVFGESSTVVCVVDGDVPRHGLVVQLDDDCPPDGPQVSDIYLTDEPDEVVATLANPAVEPGLASPPTRIPPRSMARLLAAGLEPTGAGPQPPTVLGLRALLAARCRLVSADPTPLDPGPDAAAVNRALNAFLSAPQAVGLPRTEAVVAAFELVAAFHLHGEARVGPGLSRNFLHRYLPGRLDGDCEAVTVVADVLRAYNRWVAADRNLGPAALAVLDRQTSTCAEHFRADIEAADPALPPPDWPGLFG